MRGERAGADRGTGVVSVVGEGARTVGPGVTRLDGTPATADDLSALALYNYGHFTALRVEHGRVRGLALHLRRLADDSLDEGRFVALRGFEWTTPHLGHINVWFSELWTDTMVNLAQGGRAGAWQYYFGYVPVARMLHEMGFNLMATSGTHEVLSKHDVPATPSPAPRPASTR